MNWSKSMVIRPLTIMSSANHKKTPVAVFSYNRPDHTRRTLEALSKCHRVNECDVFLFSDGAKNDAAYLDVSATRKVLHEWSNQLNAQIIEQPQNIGLAKSIVSGVTSLCEKYGRVVVIEDDLVVSPDFLHYMIESLNRYTDEEQIMQVGGFTLCAPSDLSTDCFFLPVTTTWGWGTWQRAWQKFSWEPFDLDVAKTDIEWKKRFTVNMSCSYLSMLEDRLAQKNDSWGILWWYAVSRNKGLVAYPAKSLVWNGGFDGSGIHCGSSDFLEQGDAQSYSNERLSASLQFPVEITFDPEHFFRLENFLRSRQTVAKSEARRRLGFKDIIIHFREKLRHAFS